MAAIIQNMDIHPNVCYLDTGFVPNDPKTLYENGQFRKREAQQRRETRDER